MNLYSSLTSKDLELLENIGISIENREYEKSEVKRYEIAVEDFIMSHSTKNGDIDKARNECDRILTVFGRI